MRAIMLRTPMPWHELLPRSAPALRGSALRSAWRSRSSPRCSSVARSRRRRSPGSWCCVFLPAVGAVLFLMFGRDRVRWPAKRKRELDAIVRAQVVGSRDETRRARTAPRTCASSTATPLEQALFRLGAAPDAPARDRRQQGRRPRRRATHVRRARRRHRRRAPPRARAVLPHPRRRDGALVSRAPRGGGEARACTCGSSWTASGASRSARGWQAPALQGGRRGRPSSCRCAACSSSRSTCATTARSSSSTARRRSPAASTSATSTRATCRASGDVARRPPAHRGARGGGAAARLLPGLGVRDGRAHRPATAYFPRDDRPRGRRDVAIVPSGPDTRTEAIHRLFFGAIVGATREVSLTTPYFVPTESLHGGDGARGDARRRRQLRPPGASRTTP